MGFEELLDKCIKFEDSKRTCFEKGYEAGAASRQGEVDALNALSEMSEQKIDDLVLRNTELQNIIDKALKTIEIQQRFLDDADGANKFLTSQVDELQKRIEYMKRTAQRIMVALDDGEVDHARRSARKILKGDQS